MPRAAMSEDLDLESDWSLLRPNQSGTMPRVVLPPPLDFTFDKKAAIELWVKGLHMGDPPVFTIGGADWNAATAHLCEVGRGMEGVFGFGLARQGWATNSLDATVFDTMCSLPGWLNQLITNTVAPMQINDQLLAVIDSGNDIITSMWSALWDLSFKFRERRTGAIDDRAALLRWVAGMPLAPTDHSRLTQMRVQRETVSSRERLDLCFFLLTLATQNGIFESVVLAFPDIAAGLMLPKDKRAQFVSGLGELIQATEQWGQLDSRVGLVLGLDTTEDNLSSFASELPDVGQKLRNAPGVKG